MRTDAPRPMLATLGPVPERFTDFAAEAKYDGQRGIAVVADGVVTLFSRNGADITRTFPEITAALPEAVILDGEIVALDTDGAPSCSPATVRISSQVRESQPAHHPAWGGGPTPIRRD